MKTVFPVQLGADPVDAVPVFGTVNIKILVFVETTPVYWLLVGFIRVGLFGVPINRLGVSNKWGYPKMDGL